MGRTMKVVFMRGRSDFNESVTFEKLKVQTIWSARYNKPERSCNYLFLVSVQRTRAQFFLCASELRFAISYDWQQLGKFKRCVIVFQRDIVLLTE